MSDLSDHPQKNKKPEASGLEEILELKTGHSALLGVDLGTKTIGLAISDLGWKIASPLETLKRSKLSKDVISLREIITKHEICAIILGLPLNMDGSEGPKAQSTKAFARNIYNQFELSYAFWDERLSTVAVTRTLLEADASRKRRGELVDKMAASYILQGYLDRLENLVQK